MLPTSGVFSRLVTHEIRCNREEPRALILNRCLPERADEGFLSDFFRPVPVAEPPRQISHQRGVVGPE